MQNRLSLVLFGEEGVFETAESGVNENAPDGVNVGEDINSNGEEEDALLAKEFEELIRGKYKKAFAERTKAILARRFREKAAAPEQIASESKKTDGNKADDFRATERAARIYATWEREAEKLKSEYPDFDLRAEAKDPAFVGLLRGGAGLREAYEVTHRSSLMPERLRAAVAQEALRILNEHSARAGRPDEHGSGGLSSSVTRRSVASLSRSEREKLEKRAMRGEHIVL